jgi:hypothetical protein
MALELHLRYPAQVLGGGADYPFGQARNVTVPGDGTGTPFEADLLNDWLGFFQSILLFSGIGPNFAPDSCSNHQYLDAIRYLATHPVSDIVAGGIGADHITLTGSGTFFGGTPGAGFNLLADFAWMTGTSRFDGIATHNAEILVQLTGITIGTTTVAVGSGASGLLVQVGGLRVQAGNARFDDTAEFHKEIRLADEGRVRKRGVNAPDTDFGYSVLGTDVVVFRGGVITATHNYTILDAGASPISEIEFHNYSGSVQTIKNQAGTTIGTVAIFGPFAGYARFVWEDDGVTTSWHRVE